MKKIKALILSLAILLFMGIGFMATETEAQAATATYKIYHMYYKPQNKIGKYYFKYTSGKNGDVIKISTSKTGTYKKTPLATEFVSNGTDAYYIKNTKYLYRYVFSTGKETKLKSLYSGAANPGEASFRITAVYGKKVYITRGSYFKQKLWTYVYDCTKKTYKLAKSNCELVYTIKDRAIGQNDYRSSDAPYAISYYKFSASGLTTIKKLTSKGYIFQPSGNNFYYATYPKYGTAELGGNMSITNIYSLAYTSSTPKKLVTLKTQSGGYITLYNVTASYVNYSENYETDTQNVSREIKYYFKTGKKVVVQEDIFDRN